MECYYSKKVRYEYGRQAEMYLVKDINYFESRCTEAGRTYVCTPSQITNSATPAWTRFPVSYQMFLFLRITSITTVEEYSSDMLYIYLCRWCDIARNLIHIIGTVDEMLVLSLKVGGGGRGNKAHAYFYRK